jgi:hypothetical protein
MKVPPYFVPHQTGIRALVLADVADYDAFPCLAEFWAAKLGVQIIERADGPDSRAWKGKSRGSTLWFVYDDLLADLRLVPEGKAALVEIDRLGESLVVDRERPNKAPEPTTMAVTIRAPSSTARASHGRGSS